VVVICVARTGPGSTNEARGASCVISSAQPKREPQPSARQDWQRVANGQVKRRPSELEGGGGGEAPGAHSPRVELAIRAALATLAGWVRRWTALISREHASADVAARVLGACRPPLDGEPIHL
jgi:hypothetical protein